MLGVVAWFFSLLSVSSPVFSAVCVVFLFLDCPSVLKCVDVYLFFVFSLLPICPRYVDVCLFFLCCPFGPRCFVLCVLFFVFSLLPICPPVCGCVCVCFLVFRCPRVCVC